MPNETLLKTPLHRCHLQLGARMVPFAGYEMPVQYTSVLEETKTVREAAGLFDVSHMGQFSVRGAEALNEVQKLVTNDLTRLGIGQAQYNILCDERGGTLDDLVVYRRSETEIYICVNASNRKKDFEWMRSHLGPSVSFEDQSDATALIAIQGPKAESILALGADPKLLSDLKYYWATDAKVFGVPCYLSRTGYTGEDGFELYLPKEKAAEVWDRLLEVGRKFRLVPVGLGARDTLRIEMGYPLYGHELGPDISPLAAGLQWVVKLQRSTPFIGQEALRKEAQRGSPRKLQAFWMEDRRLARQGYRLVLASGKVVGEVTSGTLSPSLGKPVGLGLLDSDVVDSETPFFVEVRETQVPAVRAKLPFTPSRTKKLSKA